MKLGLMSIFPIIPEICVGLISIFCLITGLYHSMAKAIWWIAAGLLLILLVMIMKFSPIFLTQDVVLGGIINNPINMWQKTMLISFTILILIFYGGMGKIKYWHHGHHEYICLLLFSLAACMIAISARDFLILYTSLELVAIVGYIFACYDRNTSFSAEAGMKYFILGSLISSTMIFGMSYIYGFAGSLLFGDIKVIMNTGWYSPGLIVGLLFFIIGILFKLSVAPFHFWTQDVYQGAPFTSLAYFSSLPKFTALITLINIIEYVIIDIKHLWQDAFIILAITSMMIGGFGAILQNSFKRLIGYSTILNAGFVMLALSLGNPSGYGAAIMYQIIYSVCMIGLIGVLAITIVPFAEDYSIDNLVGFGVVKKLGAFAMSIFIFSLVGIPPLAGFFGKYYIIAAVLDSEYYVASIIALLVTVISSFYYINIVRLIYFTPPNIPQIRLHETSSIVLIIFICAVFITLFPLIV